jgi:hypothetical protein
MRQHPGQLPVVQLETDSYKHDDYGKVYVPVFKLINWASEAELVELFGPGAGEVPDDPAPETQPESKQLAAPKETAADKKAETAKPKTRF